MNENLESLSDENEGLIEELIEMIFEKAQIDSRRTKQYGLCTYLHEIFEELFNMNISFDTFRRYHRGYITKEAKKRTPNNQTLDSLANYLGFDSFKDFQINSACEISKKKLREQIEILEKKGESQKVISTIINIVLLVGLFFYGYTYYKRNCMIWVEDHYEKTRCSRLVMLDKIKVEKFKKIEVCDSTTFIKNGEPVVWYDKSNNKLTYFTHSGIHPENKKTLKPITKNIIAAHVTSCK